MSIVDYVADRGLSVGLSVTAVYTANFIQNVSPTNSASNVRSMQAIEQTVCDYSPTRSCRSFVLFFVDNLLAAVVIGPLVVFYWRGTWELLNVYLFPDDQAASGWMCVAIGNVGLMFIAYLQKPLVSCIRVGNPMHWINYLYTYVLGGLNIFQWRGVWVLLDHYTGVNAPSSWITFAIGTLLFSHE